MFVPLLENRVGMYVCGPTVYSDVHLGNCRTFITFDMVYRYLLHLGYKVRYVRNITDAGHLESDAEGAEDKISKKARLEELESMEVVQRYTLGFHHVMERFNALSPSIEPTATGHIIEQVQLVEQLIDKGMAYVQDGSVYFDVNKYHLTEDYGVLSGRKIEDLMSGTRELEHQSEKRSPLDFALWKKASPQHLMRWPSPWGEGFPGWHLECTAMSIKYLGETFDIHGGGMDLKFPHHECEIAQAKAANGKSPVNYWLHANMLTLNGQKMSKSTGNTILPEELFSGENAVMDRGYSPEVVRFSMMQAHYRNVLDFSASALSASEKGFHKLMETVRALEQLSTSDASSEDVPEMIAGFYAAMNDDFNTPVLIARLFDAATFVNKVKAQTAAIAPDDLAQLKQAVKAFVFDVLGLRTTDAKSDASLHSVMDILLEIRRNAREQKDWATADFIRDQLERAGIAIQDGADGSDWSTH